MKSKWMSRAGYVGLGLGAFFYFLFHGFPFDRVVATELQGLEKEAGVRVEVGSVKAGWLFNLVATDVRVSPKGKRGFSSVSPEESPEPLVIIERVSVSPRPLSLFRGRLGIGMKGRAYGGKVSGAVALGRTSTDLAFDVEGLDLAKYGLLANKFQVHVGGEVSGVVALVIDAEDPSKTTGEIDLTIENARIDESNPYGIQEIPATVFGRGGVGRMVIRDGKVEFQEVGLHGEDLDLSLEGELVLNRNMALSRWAARSAVKMSDSFKSAVPMADMFMGPGKGTDGVYRYKLSGILARPNPVPDRSAR